MNLEYILNGVRPLQGTIELDERESMCRESVGKRERERERERERVRERERERERGLRTNDNKAPCVSLME